MNTFAIAGLGATEMLIILAVIVLLFGASKLPELARGSGRALRIFKAETKGLHDDDTADDDVLTVEQRELEARNVESRNVETQRREHPHGDTTT